MCKIWKSRVMRTRRSRSVQKTGVEMKKTESGEEKK